MRKPNMDSKFGPMTSDILGNCELDMFKALIKLIPKWPDQEMMSKICPDAVKSVARHFGVEPFQLYHLFATFWFEHVEDLALEKAQARREVQLRDLEQVFADAQRDGEDLTTCEEVEF